jgi:hypothetical protein
MTLKRPSRKPSAPKTIPALRAKSLQAVCHALREREVVDLVHASVKTGYLEFFQNEPRA